jgi:hypothetical protein
LEKKNAKRPDSLVEKQPGAAVCPTPGGRHQRG